VAVPYEADANLRVVRADHANWRVRDLQASLHFYQDVLGLQAYDIDSYNRGESHFVSLRISEDFVLHLRPDPELDSQATGGYDHLALVVEETTSETLARHLTSHGIEIERTLEKPKGAKGVGPAIYVRDPDGYLIELKIYDTTLELYDTELKLQDTP